MTSLPTRYTEWAMLAAAVLCTALAGCSSPTGPVALPGWTQGAEPIQPTAQHRTWWAEVEECTGESRAISEVEWFVIEGNGPMAAYFPETSALYLHRAFKGVKDAVTHEIGHALGYPGHPDPPFGTCVPNSVELGL